MLFRKLFKVLKLASFVLKFLKWWKFCRPWLLYNWKFDDINIFRVTTLPWNKALWLDVASQVTIFNQWECIITEWSKYSSLKFAFDVNSWWCSSLVSMTLGLAAGDLFLEHYVFSIYSMSSMAGNDPLKTHNTIIEMIFCSSRTLQVCEETSNWTWLNNESIKKKEVQLFLEKNPPAQFEGTTMTEI